MLLAHRHFGLIALVTLVSSACQSSGGSFFGFDKRPDLTIPRAEVKEVSEALGGHLAVLMEVEVRNRGKWLVNKPFRVGVVARNPALAPDPMKPLPDPDSYAELVVGLWSGPPVAQFAGQAAPPVVSGIPVDMPINPKQKILLERQLYFHNPWPGESLELVITADWNHEVAETNETNNVRTIPF